MICGKPEPVDGFRFVLGDAYAIRIPLPKMELRNRVGGMKDSAFRENAQLFDGKSFVVP